MSFFKKTKEIEIIAPLDGNLDVQTFAGKYAKTGTPIEVEVHGSLYNSDRNLVSIRFTTNETRETVAEQFLREFSEKRPTVGRRLMFCH